MALFETNRLYLEEANTKKAVCSRGRKTIEFTHFI